jgi:hypothetical protein
VWYQRLPLSTNIFDVTPLLEQVVYLYGLPGRAAHWKISIAREPLARKDLQIEW